MINRLKLIILMMWYDIGVESFERNERINDETKCIVNARTKSVREWATKSRFGERRERSSQRLLRASTSPSILAPTQNTSLQFCTLSMFSATYYSFNTFISISYNYLNIISLTNCSRPFHFLTSDLAWAVDLYTFR
jgi:hypothetical protein